MGLTGTPPSPGLPTKGAISAGAAAASAMSTRGPSVPRYGSFGTGAQTLNGGRGNPYAGMPTYGSNEYSQALTDAFGAQYPTRWADVAQIGLGQQSARDRHRFDQAGNALDANRLNSNYQLGNREIDLQLAGVGFDRERNELRRQGIGLDRADIGAQRGFNQRDLDMTLADALAGGVRKTRQNNSDATARGAWFAPMRGIRNDDIRFDTQMAGDRARLGYDRDTQALNSREGQLGLDEKGLDIANRELDNQAAKLGLNRDQLRATLDQGIAQLGLQGQISTNQLMNQLASGDLQHAQLIQGILQDIMSSGMAGDFMRDGRGGSVLRNFGPW